ncbi:hypothetical protein GH714_033143 [Hevea brasiliensis]|uniref:Uncharacterized protein n=1 Tax=Hevea brasiliensis TaxID=3981 RepID=A0A6A6KDB9_HEVBR|nr:hypothetical protein GH714_033143 [Hevea brasiliensis]
MKITDWIKFWFCGVQRYVEPPKLNGQKRVSCPRRTFNPSGIIDKRSLCTKGWSKPLFELRVSVEAREEVCRTTFLACWLCKFILLGKDADLIRPSTFKGSSKAITNTPQVDNSKVSKNSSCGAKRDVASKEHVLPSNPKRKLLLRLNELDLEVEARLKASVGFVLSPTSFHIITTALGESRPINSMEPIPSTSQHKSCKGALVTQSSEDNAHAKKDSLAVHSLEASELSTFCGQNVLLRFLHQATTLASKSLQDNFGYTPLAKIPLLAKIVFEVLDDFQECDKIDTSIPKERFEGLLKNIDRVSQLESSFPSSISLDCQVKKLNKLKEELDNFNY